MQYSLQQKGQKRTFTSDKRQRVIKNGYTEKDQPVTNNMKNNTTV
jgi:hypothetical protein